MRSMKAFRAAPLVVVVSIGLALAGCGGSDSPDETPTAGPETATFVATPDNTAAPSPTATASPTATEPPPTATPTPEPVVLADRTYRMERFRVPAGSRPHDVAPALDGGVWFTAQGSGHLGWLDPETGESRLTPLGAGSAPHGVVVGPDGALWITDGGLNAIVRVDPETDEVTVYPLPADRPNANLNTGTFDNDGIHWFTGQNGIYGRLDPATGEMEVFDAPGGAGPYGIDTTPGGDVYYVSLRGSHLAYIERETRAATRIDPPTAGQGARRVWSDSEGRLWISEWNSGQLSMFDPASDEWREWPLPGNNPQPYAVYVDEDDGVWVTDFGSNTLVFFNPQTEEFSQILHPTPNANVRQLLGREGEVWGAESGTEHLVVVRW
jgi:virginiamycin B lyase